MLSFKSSTGACLGNPGRQRGAEDPQTAKRQLLPRVPGARRTAEKALSAVIQEAYIQGISTRSVDDLVKTLSIGGVSESQVSRLCGYPRDLNLDWCKSPQKAAHPCRAPVALKKIVNHGQGVGACAGIRRSCFSSAQNPTGIGIRNNAWLRSTSLA